MKNRKKWGLPVGTLLMFVAAAVMLLTSTVGGARAALTFYSEAYTSRMQMRNIGVTLMENGREISWRNYGQEADGSWSSTENELLSGLLGEGETLQPGKAYKEELAVRNSGTIDQYVRVSLYRYWLDQDGNKLRTLSPDLIHLKFAENSGWIQDPDAATEERLVFYYQSPLGAEETTPALVQTLSIDPSIASHVTQEEREENGGTTIVTTYDYDGVQFRLEAEVNAVQTHNGEDAIWSAWGRQVNISDGILSLA